MGFAAGIGPLRRHLHRHQYRQHGHRKTTTTQSAEIQAQAVRLLGYELELPLRAERGALTYTLAGRYIVPRRTPDDPATPLSTGAYLSLQVDFTFLKLGLYY